MLAEMDDWIGIVNSLAVMFLHFWAPLNPPQVTLSLSLSLPLSLSLFLPLSCPPPGGATGWLWQQGPVCYDPWEAQP